jgi:small subunit ribosomal protein S27Ae
MAILKYYKVESDGKIKRLRRECPTPTCGAGVFVRALFLDLELSHRSI